MTYKIELTIYPRDHGDSMILPGETENIYLARAIARDYDKLKKTLEEIMPGWELKIFEDEQEITLSELEAAVKRSEGRG